MKPVASSEGAVTDRSHYRARPVNKSFDGYVHFKEDRGSDSLFTRPHVHNGQRSSVSKQQGSFSSLHKDARDLDYEELLEEAVAVLGKESELFDGSVPRHPPPAHAMNVESDCFEISARGYCSDPDTSPPRPRSKSLR